MKRAWKYSLLLILCSLAVGMFQPCFAQSVQGTVLGLVTDAKGAVIPKATVEVINRDTSFTRTVTTDSTGHYRVPGLEPSTYAVEVSFAGFKKWSSDPFTLVTSQIRRVDVTLEVGSTTTTVTVSAGAGTAVETETASLSNLHGSREFTQLPQSIYGRSFANVAKVTAAVQGANGQFVVNGAPDSANNFTLDGVTTMDLASTRVSPDNFDIDIDGIQTLKVQTANNSAEYGQVAQFSAYSKAGTNQYHGSGWWGNFNSYFSTRDFFDTTSQKPSFTNNNEMAGTIGGPVRIPGLYNGKDKTFFFFSYGGQRYRVGARSYFSVPTQDFRNGNFSALLNPANGGTPIQLYQPNSGPTPSDPTTWLPFAGNIIPSGQISSVSSTLQSMLYPAPNRPGTGDFGIGNNYTYDPGYQFNYDAYSIRVDQKISSRNTMFARLGITAHNQDIDRGYLLNGLDGNYMGNIPGHNFVLSDTQTISPTLLNEARFGFTRLLYTNGTGADLNVDYISQLGLQGVGGVGDPAYANNLPRFQFDRFIGTSGTNHNNNAQNIFEYTDNMTWIHNKHTFKWGTDVQRYQLNNVSIPNNHVGAFGFSDNISGFDYANFLLGYPSTTTLATPTPGAYSRSTLFSFYVQDDMRVTPKLTVNYGIRYEYQSPWTEKFDRRYTFDLSNGSLVVAGAQMPTDLVPQVAATLPIETSTQAGFPTHSLMYADKNNWNPRLGIAYRPFGGDKTVVRAAYGWYTSMLPGSLGTTGLGGPWTTNTSFDYQGGLVTQMFPNPFTQSTSYSGVTSISSVDPNYVNMRVQQWNFSIGREFLGTAIDVAYTGTKTTHLPDTMNYNLLHPSTTPYSAANLPYPLFNTVNMTESGGSSIYHGLTVQADHRFRNGLQFNANYAWAKGMTAYSLWGGGGFQQNQYNQQLEYAPDPLVRKQQLEFDFVYELPVGHGKQFLSQMNPVLNQVIGGWQVVGITTMLSGQYLNPSFSGVDPANTNQFGGRPDCVGNGNIGGIGGLVRSGQSMYNLSAFQLPTGGRGYYGNCGRSALVGPGKNLWNAGLFKNFMLKEGVRLQIQWQLFNAWNHANFGNGNTNITSGNFGNVSSGGGGRSMMFGARIDF